jgi:protein-disulfide isomerase
MGEAKRRQTQSEPAPRRRGRRGSGGLIAGLVLTVAIVAGLVYWLTTPTLSPLDDLPRAAEGAPAFPAELDRFGVSLGDPQAPVVVREFADYQCPACAQFSEVAQRLKADYIEPGKVRLVFFDFPLEQHRNAVPSAQAARCAADQEAYWPMHELLFARQERWADSSAPQALFADYARELNLDSELFERCLSSGRHLDAVQRSLQAARQLRLSSTPTVFVDNVQLTRPGWYQLAGVVERQLQAAQ